MDEEFVELRTNEFMIAPEGKLMVRVSMDGTIEFGPDYKPNETAQIFWQAISFYFPGNK